MNNMKAVLALAVVMAMAGTTFADITISLTDTYPGTQCDLEVYTANIQGAKTFGSIAIDGLVHQTQEDMGAGHNPSPYIDNFAMPNNAGGPLDTHFLFKMGDVLGANLGSVVDTTDDGNPAGLDVNPTALFTYHGEGIFSGVGPIAGISDDIAVTLQGAAATAALGAEGYDFLQVVIRKGTVATLTGSWGNDEAFSREFGTEVPEPSTGLMLLACSLCFLGVRMRK